ncbi:MAG TPA: aminoglycoside adenylyltransferase domain-containing protein [Aggregatilineaceae bacterium]|nr:aminoglycoside adenylyltransferase domain-containing protein [Aggregatilineaceae bacterium]
MNKPTPYVDLNEVLGELVRSIQGILGAQLTGFYLQGSFAVGDFDEHSDVDFIAVIEDELTGEQVQALDAMHDRIYGMAIPWAQHLEGSYFPKALLRDVTGKDLWFLDHGSRSLVRDKHCNTLVVRWCVREKGIALVGPEPTTLIDPVAVDDLRAEIWATMQDWGQEILTNTEHFNNRFYQAFIVLSYCRMLHSLHVGRVDSKRAGAAWAKATLDPMWAGLIDRTWAGRPNPAVSVRTRADAADCAATLDFVRMAMAEGRRVMEG